MERNGDWHRNFKREKEGNHGETRGKCLENNMTWPLNNENHGEHEEKPLVFPEGSNLETTPMLSRKPCKWMIQLPAIYGHWIMISYDFQTP